MLKSKVNKWRLQTWMYMFELVGYRVYRYEGKVKVFHKAFPFPYAPSQEFDRDAIRTEALMWRDKLNRDAGY